MNKLFCITILFITTFTYSEDLYQRKGFNYWEVTFDLTEANEFEREKKYTLADESIRNSFKGPADEYITFLLNERRYLRTANPTWLYETEKELKDKIIESIDMKTFPVEMLPPSISFNVLETDWTGVISRYELAEYFTIILKKGIRYEYIKHKETGSYFIFFIEDPPNYNSFFNEWKTIIVYLDYLSDTVYKNYNDKYCVLSVQFDSYLIPMDVLEEHVMEYLDEVAGLVKFDSKIIYGIDFD